MVGTFWARKTGSTAPLAGTVAIAGFLAIGLTGLSGAIQPVAAASLNARGKVIEKRLYDSGMIQALTSKVGRTRGSALLHKGKLLPYRRLQSPKAMALCVRWRRATRTYVPMVGKYFVYRNFNAESAALRRCKRRHESKGCTCSVFDIDDRSGLKVPTAVMRRLGGLK